MSVKNASQPGEASEAWIYDWSSSCHAACINSSTICFSVAGLWRCLSRIASSRADSGERLMLRMRRPAPERRPPQLPLRLVMRRRLGVWMDNAINTDDGNTIAADVVFIRINGGCVEFRDCDHCFQRKHPRAQLILMGNLLFIGLHFLDSLSCFHRTNLVHLNCNIFQDESQCFSSDFLGHEAHPEKLVG